MSYYLQVSDLKARWTAERVDEVSGADDAKVLEAIEKTEREVEAGLRQRYGDLGDIRASPPPDVIDLVEELALETLYSLRGYDQLRQDVEDAATAARRRLDRIVRGFATIDVSTAPATDRPAGVGRALRQRSAATLTLDRAPLSSW